MDYNQTLNLPKTDFPMRAGLPKREPEFLARWEANDQYKKLMDHNDGKPLFVLPTPPFPEVITITSLIGTSSCILFYHFILL